MSAKETKRKSPASPEALLGEALERLAQTKPEEPANSLAEDVLQTRKRIKERVEKARQEIEDGARPLKGRFRL